MSEIYMYTGASEPVDGLLEHGVVVALDELGVLLHVTAHEQLGQLPVASDDGFGDLLVLVEDPLPPVVRVEDARHPGDEGVVEAAAVQFEDGVAGKAGD